MSCHRFMCWARRWWWIVTFPRMFFYEDGKYSSSITKARWKAHDRKKPICPHEVKP